MSTGNELFALAVPHLGEKYSLGVVVPKNYKNYSGPWDCAEFASWLVYQLTGKLYGCADNNGNPASADAYSGFWARDAVKIGFKISVAEAATIFGAMVVRIAGKDLIGHVVVSDGAGGTIEAHSTKTGVIRSTLNHRRWDFGVVIPWVDYSYNATSLPNIKGAGKIYRWTSPMMKGDKVALIQGALGIKADGFFGPNTHNAVKSFQRNSGIVADGEVGQQTATLLGITI